MRTRSAPTAAARQRSGHDAEPHAAALSDDADTAAARWPMVRGPFGAYAEAMHRQPLEGLPMNATRTSTAVSSSRLRWAVLTAASSLVLLAACGKQDDRTVGQKVDAAVNSAEQKTDEAAEKLRQETADLKERSGEALDKAADKTTSAANQVVEKVEDAAITTSVNAELAKDSTLSALSINVDTAAGAVTLRGTAPSAVARERASTLAKDVKGVHSVDNQLLVKG
jgi:hyperosmotically inducible periplasmic protein